MIITASSSHLLNVVQSSSVNSIDSVNSDSTNPARRSSSSNNIGFGCSTIYTNLWRVLLSLSTDPHPVVRENIKYIVNSMKLKVSYEKKV